MSARFRASAVRAAALALAISVAACSSGGRNPVTGKVTFKGNPATGALVIFHPKGQDDKIDVDRPTAVVTADGSFAVETVRTPGAAAGEYSVTVTMPAAAAGAKGKPMGMGGGEEKVGPADAFGGKYADRKTTPLKATIKPGPNALEPFALD